MSIKGELRTALFPTEESRQGTPATTKTVCSHVGAAPMSAEHLPERPPVTPSVPRYLARRLKRRDRDTDELDIHPFQSGRRYFKDIQRLGLARVGYATNVGSKRLFIQPVRPLLPLCQLIPSNGCEPQNAF